MSSTDAQSASKAVKVQAEIPAELGERLAGVLPYGYKTKLVEGLLRVYVEFAEQGDVSPLTLAAGLYEGSYTLAEKQ